MFFKLRGIIITKSLSILIIFNSCNTSSWYDKKSDVTSAVPSSLTDLQALLDNADLLNLYSPGMGEIASDGHYIRPSIVNQLDNLSMNAYTWSKIYPYTVVPDWNGSSLRSGPYPRIFTCNVVIEGLDKIKPGEVSEQLEWNNIYGQALFHRARTFYELAQIFAQPYNLSSAETDLGIPLRLESDYNVQSVRASVKKTYDQITSDLLRSIDLLPRTPKFKTRPSKRAVYAMLARVYLSMGEYQKAGEVVDTCLSLQNELIDFATLDTLSPSPIEKFNEEVIFHSEMPLYNGIYSGVYMLIDTSLYNSYDNDDLRKKIFFISNSSASEITYKGSYVGSPYYLFSGLAVDELYLIRAESYARAGDVNSAMKYLNDLLTKRWRAVNGSSIYINQTASDADDALRKILNERKKELLLRGLRWTDLRRLNMDNRFQVILTRTIGSNMYTIEPNSYRYTFPIPDDVIQLSGMQQNPNW